MEATYIPRYHLFPTNPQILHHLVLELFIRTPQHEQQTESFYSMVPSGPIYKYGGALAHQWKQIFQSHPAYKTLVLISFEEMAPDVAGIITADERMHTFFGTVQLDKTDHAGGLMQSSEMFAMYAKSIEAQLPFVRAYKHLDNVVPYVINISKDQDSLEDILDTIKSHHGDDACYVFVQPEKGIDKIAAYLEKI